MLARLRKRHEENESGFTLIELLVVIIIIGILAAIAIPTFLKQREKGWDAAVKSSLKNAATAQESYYTDSNPSQYAATGSLDGEGFNASDNVSLSVESNSATGYCMEAFHSAKPTKYWYISSDGGSPTLGQCP